MPKDAISSELRPTGIAAVGDMPWGTHLCHFYETKQALLDILVPYFKTGLENNERCLWVTSDPITVDEASHVLRQAVPDLDRHLAEQTIEILPYEGWYLKDGSFNPKRVTDGLCKKLQQALTRGFVGMRVNGNTTWLKREIWNDFVDYEREVNNSIVGQRLIALCTYSLATCNAADVLDVARAHERVVTTRGGHWEAVDIPELGQAKAEIKRLNQELDRGIVERTVQLATTNERSRIEIAERKRTDEALVLFRTLIDYTTDSIEVIDPETGRFLDVNEQACRDHGYTREEFLKLSVRDIEAKIDIASDDAWRANVEAFRRQDFQIVEGAHRRKDGSVFPVEINARYIRLDRDYLVAVVRNITERKLAEEARTRLAAVVETSDDAIISKNLNGIILTWNRGAERLYGYKAEEAIGRPISIIIPPDVQDDLPSILERIKKGEPIKHYETVRVTKNGRRINVSLSISPLKSVSQQIVGAAVIARDITERKLAETERERLHKRVKRARDRLRAMSLKLIEAQEAERRRIARELHDEIGQILAVLKLSLTPREQEPTPSKESIREARQRVDELLARVRSMSLDLRPTMLDDLGLLPALLWHVERYRATTGVRVEFQHSGLENRRFQSEIETAIYRVIQEGLNNVARHAGAPLATVQVWTDEDTISAQVKDSGKGFDSTAALNTAVSSGLSGMRERVTLFGGKITIDSAPGRGTRLNISLPVDGGGAK